MIFFGQNVIEYWMKQTKFDTDSQNHRTDRFSSARESISETGLQRV